MENVIIVNLLKKTGWFVSGSAGQNRKSQLRPVAPVWLTGIRYLTKTSGASLVNRVRHEKTSKTNCAPGAIERVSTMKDPGAKTPN